MKRLRIGFLAVIAILAMSFTVADHEGIIKKAQVTCFATDWAAIQIPNGTTYTQDVTACPQFSQTCARLITPSANDVVCPGGQTFCCAKIVSPNPNPACAAQPAQFRTLVNVFCMP